MMRTLVVLGFVALAPIASAAPTASMTADEAYVKSVSLTQESYSKLSGDNAELRAMLNTALGKLKDLETRANAQDQAAKTTLIAFANNDTASGVDQLTAQAKVKAQSSAAQAKSAAADYKAAGALAFARDTPRAIAAYEAALALEPNDAEILHQLAWLYEERLSQYDKTLALADREIALPAPDAKARGYLDRGNALWRKGDLAGAQAAQEAALNIATKNKLKVRQAQALNNLANVAAYRGDYASAEAYDKRSLAVAIAAGDKRSQAITLGNLGDDAKYRGDYAGAEKYLMRALALSSTIGDGQIQARHLNQLGEIVVRRGDKTAACEHFKRAVAINESIGANSGPGASAPRSNMRSYCPAPTKP